MKTSNCSLLKLVRINLRWNAAFPQQGVDRRHAAEQRDETKHFLLQTSVFIITPSTCFIHQASRWRSCSSRVTETNMNVQDLSSFNVPAGGHRVESCTSETVTQLQSRSGAEPFREDQHRSTCDNEETQKKKRRACV